MIQGKKDIRTIETEELVAFFESHGDKKFRAKQVMEWLWKKGAGSF
ncbi:MAG: 23S rRNA (adenine(2503)-C(2))-methyltransferase RlmN, partial [Flavobacteriales bacterium]